MVFMALYFIHTLLTEYMHVICVDVFMYKQYNNNQVC